MSKSDLIDLAVEIRAETLKAWLVHDGHRDVWIPKSQCEVTEERGPEYYHATGMAGAEDGVDLMFYVGQKVVCVEPSRGGGYPDDIVPYVGGIYTIRGIDANRAGGAYHTGLFLEEIVNPLRGYAGYVVLSEASFRATRFRPLTERKTDISVFRALLNPADHKELVS